MKRVSIIILAAVLCLSMAACSPKETQISTSQPTASEVVMDNVYHPETDCHYMYRNSYFGFAMTESPDAYYIHIGDTVYVIDKETFTFSPLCGKPNCRHQNETDNHLAYKCDAYFGVCQLPLLEYFDGYLYITTTETVISSFSAQYNIIRMKPDGTQRKIVTTLPQGTEECIMHRGYFYLASKVYNKEMNAKYGVQRIPISGGEPELIYVGQIEGGQISNLTAFGDYIYFQDQIIGPEYDIRTMCYNLKTGEAKNIVKAPELVDPMRMYIVDGKIFGSLYHCRDQKNSEDAYYDRYISELDGSNQKIVEMPFDKKDATWSIFSDGKNLWRYTIPWAPGGDPDQRIMEKLDSNYNVVAAFPELSYGRSVTIFPGNDDYLFIVNQEGETDTSDGELAIYAVDKNPEDGILKKTEILRMDYDNVIRGITLEGDETDIYIADRG